MNTVINDQLSAADMVNLVRYPITSLGSVEGSTFALQCRSQYRETGLCIIADFITADALEILADEANIVSDQSYFCKSTHNAYLTADDSEIPVGDVSRRREETLAGSVAYDLIDKDAYLRRLYSCDPLKEFIGFVLGKSLLYRFADPLGACSINVFVDGGEHGWHFDESEFTITLLLQPPESGGSFEYVAKIRGLENEKDIVAGVLDGERSQVVELPFSAGTLLIFGGQQTLHRVTRVSGNRLRLASVLCYSEQPDMKNSESVGKLFWDRTCSEIAS